MSADRYAELGHLVADLVDRGRQHPRRTAAAEPRPQPTVRAAHRAVRSRSSSPAQRLACRALQRVFDDENVARILSGQQFIDIIPRQIRREMVDKHITRLVKSDIGEPVFETIESEDDVIKLAGRYGAFDVVEEFGVDADRDARARPLHAGWRSAPALTRCATRASRWCSTTTPPRSGPQLPDRWGLPDEMRDDTGVIFASAFPGYDSFVNDLNHYHEDRAAQTRTRDARGRARAG